MTNYDELHDAWFERTACMPLPHGDLRVTYGGGPCAHARRARPRQAPPPSALVVAGLAMPLVCAVVGTMSI